MTAGPAIWVDGSRADALQLPDRGLDFGDGLFETLLLREGQPLLLDYHWQRLNAGLQTLNFPDVETHARACLQQACAELETHPWAALRLAITRGTAPRGYAPPADAVPRVIISAAPLRQDRTAFAEPARVGWAEIRWSSQPLLAGLKHLNRLEQVLAAGEAQDRELDEVLVLDQDGAPSSVSAGNLFIYSNGCLRTPSLETCGVMGTRRRFILEQVAPALDIAVEQGTLSCEDVCAADELFYCNSLRGLQAVGELDDVRWQAHPVTRAIHDKYWELLAC